MNQRCQILLCLTVLFVGALFGTTLLFLPANTALADSNLSAVLPTSTELPGFLGLKTRPVSKDGVYSIATRKTDKMFLTIYVFKTSSEMEARQLIKNGSLSAQSSGPKKGSPSGRLIGQESWHFSNKRTPSDSFQLITRDGLAVVVVQATAPAKGRDAAGNVIRGVISQADVKFLENLAIGRLNKLAKLGLTR